MKNDSTDDLYGIGLFLEDTPCCFSYSCKSLGKDIVESLAVLQSLLEFGSFCLQFSVGEFLILLIQFEYFILYRLYALQLAV